MDNLFLVPERDLILNLDYLVRARYFKAETSEDKPSLYLSFALPVGGSQASGESPFAPFEQHLTGQRADDLWKYLCRRCHRPARD